MYKLEWNLFMMLQSISGHIDLLYIILKHFLDSFESLWYHDPYLSLVLGSLLASHLSSSYLQNRDHTNQMMNKLDRNFSQCQNLIKRLQFPIAFSQTLEFPTISGTSRCSTQSWCIIPILFTNWQERQQYHDPFQNLGLYSPWGVLVVLPLLLQF